MDGWRGWKKLIVTALGVAGMTFVGVADLGAQMLHSAIQSERETAVPNGINRTRVNFVPAGTVLTQRISHAREDGQALVRGLQSEWEAVRADLTRCVLETTLTAFFIRIPPPPKPPKKKKNTPPPQNQGGDPPPPPPPPPPPGGNGEPPQLPPPPPDSPPQSAPEPGSFAIAFLGAGLTSWAAWRRRRKVPLTVKFPTNT